MATHMTPDEFRRHGRQAVDWLAGYAERIESLPVLSRAQPGDLRAVLPASPPERGEPFEALLSDLDTVVLPGLTHWQHPNFYAYFPTGASGPSVLADLISSGLGVLGMLWATSPACTELEQHVLDWFAELLDLPERFRSAGDGGAVIQDTASTATFTAVLAALHRATGGAFRTAGARGRYAVYASDQAHFAIHKAVLMAGLGEDSLRTVASDPATLSMDPDRLREMIRADLADGVLPVLVHAAVGATGTGAVDPVAAIGRICRGHGVWLHVDAAWAGVAAICPELRWIHDGVGEYADSYCVNPHKWLLTNFDLDAFYLADRAALLGALAVSAEVLRNAASETGAVTDFRDWHPQLGRRFRALKLWAVIRWYGAEGLRAHIRKHVELAAAFADRVRGDDRFELPVAPTLSLVCFRLRGPDRLTEDLRDRLNSSGAVYLTHTKVSGRTALRLAVGAERTERHHVEQAWRHIQAAADAVVGGGAPRR